MPIGELMKTSIALTTRENTRDLQPAPAPCLWDGCPLLLWHTGPHLPANTNVGIEPRVEKREGGRIVYWNVKDNDRKGYCGRIAHGQHAELAPRQWIRLFGIDNRVAFDRVFRPGDEVAYSGYNLTYTGNIVGIGHKTISVRDERVTKRLSIYDFLFWNRKFDAARVRAANLEVLERI
jgi:hypothetical protein